MKRDTKMIFVITGAAIVLYAMKQAKNAASLHGMGAMLPHDVPNAYAALQRAIEHNDVWFGNQFAPQRYNQGPPANTPLMRNFMKRTGAHLPMVGDQFVVTHPVYNYTGFSPGVKRTTTHPLNSISMW